MPHTRTTRYAVVDPPSATLTLVLTAAATLAVIGLSLTLARELATGTLWPVPWLAAACAALALVAMGVLHGRRSVALEAGVLVVRAGLNTRRVAATALELERARILDLEERHELLPGRRTFGASRRGYQSGWFRTRAWGKGFYLLTERRRVLWLPMRDGGAHLLLSLQEPQALLAALNALAPRHDRG